MNKTLLILQKLFWVALFFCFLIPTVSKAQEDKGKGIIITAAPKINIVLNSVKHNLCSSEKKGAINIMAFGGFPPYKYKWSTGDTTQDISGLKSGKYTVIVYDEFEGGDTMEIEIKEPQPLTIKVDSVKDILCFGYNQGQVNITVTGGEMPYQYTWNNGSSQEDLKNATSGNYSVLVTDANNCQNIAVAAIKQKPLIVRNIDDVEHIKCFGDETGQVNIDVAGGVPPYEYYWDSGDTTEDLKNVRAGIYEVTVRDAEGCTEVSVTKVEQPDVLDLALDKITHIKCNGDKGGAINMSVNGGVVPYTYKWSNGSTTQDIAGLPAGNYTLSVVDKNGCKLNFAEQITQPPLLDLKLVEHNNVSYFEGNNGSINISVTGGMSPYKYEWSSGQKTQDIAALKAGAYTVKVTDATGCTKVMTSTIMQPEKLVVSLVTKNDIKCNGEKSGSIDVEVTGGVKPYNFKWNNGETTEDLKGVGAGDYSVTVTDANGHKRDLKASLKQPTKFVVAGGTVKHIDCFGDYKGLVDINVSGGEKPYSYKWNNGIITQDVKDVPAGTYSVQVKDANGCQVDYSAEVKQSEDINLKLQNVIDVKCFEVKNGAVDITVTGGVPPYKYKWSNGSYSQDIMNLGIGEYSVNVTDAKGCSKSTSAKIVQPKELMVEKEASKDVTCFGTATGALSIRVKGGVAPYNYVWNNGKTTEDITELTSGSYTVKVKDKNGCSATISETINQPTQLTRTVDNVTHVKCFGESKGAIDISVLGGTTPYQYQWSNSSTTQDLANIKAGNYSVKIKDAKGCEVSASATINENPELKASLTSSTDIKCFGDKKGVANITVSGGIPPYTYKWSNGLVTQDMYNVEAGTYSVNVLDVKGCSKVVNVEIKQPPALTSKIISETDIKCFGNKTGAISVDVKGGVTPYKFMWSNGATSQNLSALGIGTYNLKTTDANGCTTSVSTKITEPAKLYSSTKAVTDVRCFDANEGGVDITVTGGVAPYKYSWNNGATTQDLTGVKAGKYNVKIVEANGCETTQSAEVKQPANLEVSRVSVQDISCYGDKSGNVIIAVKGGVAPYKYSWSNGAITQNISNVGAGSYTVTVVDMNGCVKTLTANIKEPSQLLSEVTEVKNNDCYDDAKGVIQVAVKGGVTPYKYLWSRGDTIKNLMNVKAGTYTLKITDAKGCSSSITQSISQPTKLEASLTSVENVKCNGDKTGSVNITVNGGIAPYKYSWSNESTLQDLLNVGVGNYSVKVQDAKGCLSSPISAKITEPNKLTAKVDNVKNVLDYGHSTGAIAISVSGGKPLYQYSWSNGSKLEDIAAVPAGNYSVLISDANSCLTTLTADITQPPALEAEIADIKDISCSGDKTGAISLSVTGGKTPYTYVWSNGSTSKNVSGLGAGSYTVTVKDANGLSKVLTAKVDQPAAFVLVLDNVTNLSCNKDGSGAVNITVTGGRTPYSYKWSNGATTQDLQGAQAGTYNLTVTDRNSCVLKKEVTITEPAPLVGNVASVQNVNCNGTKEGSINLNVSGGVAPYGYKWSNGAVTQNISKVSAGNYSVKITDQKGCFKNVSSSIQEPPKLRAEIANVEDNACNGESKGIVKLSVTGGVAPYNYKWSNGDSIKDVSGLIAGRYSVKIVDAKGCSESLSANIEEPVKLFAKVGEVLDVQCSGDKKGQVKVNVEGGVPPYRYSWSNGANTKDLMNVAAGPYSMTVSDSKGCGSTINANISQPSPLMLDLDTVRHISCYGTNKGAVEISVRGGVKPYNYTWSNGDATEDAINLLAGEYTVKVKDANNCPQTITTVIKQPSELTVKASEIGNVKCFGENSGKVSITVSGGVEPYNYKWSNGVSSRDVVDAGAGAYSVDVTDANGCVTSLSSEITQPKELIKNIDAVTDIRCFGKKSGSISVSVLEGTPPYNFSWNNGSSTEDIDDLSAGEYILKITEGNGCVSQLSATIQEPPVFTAAINDVKHVKCFGDKTGSIDVNVTGGVAPYTYNWSNDAKTEDLISIGSDHYMLMVTDANECLQTVNTMIRQPTPLEVIIDSTRNVKCCGDNSGAIFVSVEGGIKPYSYLWTNGATTQDIENLVKGRYSLTVTDGNGCTAETPDGGLDLYDKILTQGKFVSHDILFDVGSANIKKESFGPINKISTMMKDHPDLRLRIEGHTDSDGDSSSNQKLSEARAKSIREALIKFGIHESRLESKGWGESKPVDTNATSKGKANNRRVEFIAI